jgi:hypothetical protein
MRAEDLLDQIEDRARDRLRADLRSLHDGTGAATLRELVLGHPALSMAGVALASAALAPLLVRLLRSPPRAARIAGLAAPFVRDFLAETSREQSPAAAQRGPPGR